jgi:uncharacterized protein YndB with AHSA1/START domain
MAGVATDPLLDLSTLKCTGMDKLTFKTTFDAPREKVWDVLWTDDTYREWTSVFSPGSRAETDWKEGGKVLFLNREGDGMVSRIAKKKDNEFMSFEHLGEVHNGVENLDSEKVRSWAGAFENYTLNSVDGKTELLVEMDVTDEFKDYFATTWPKAFEKLKSLVEKSKQEVVTH